MSDDKKDRGPQDRSRINMNEEYEVQYWTKKFGVTKEKLAEAVRAVGNSAAKVEERLGHR